MQLTEDNKVSFTISANELISLPALTHSAAQFLSEECHVSCDGEEHKHEKYDVDDLKLVGYVEKDSQDFIHANTYTSAEEIVQDANEICLSVSPSKTL